MSRHGYSDDLDHWDLIRYRGAVASSIRGKRGQKFLRDMAAALDAMPEKRLIAGELVLEGDVCALGALGVARGIDLSDVDPEDNADYLAAEFNVAEPLIREITFINDETSTYPAVGYQQREEIRWQQVRKWVGEQIVGGEAVEPGRSEAEAGPTI
jgi:hypothetical protein